MNIGIVTTWFERGAGYVSKQYEEVLSNSHDVFIYARGGEKYAIGDPKWDKENVTWGKRSLFHQATEIDKAHFKKWIENNEIELILFNEQRKWESVIVANKLDVITGAYIDYYKEDTVPLFGIYDFLVCNTKRHYSVFDWHPQVFYIPWGTDINLFSPKKKPKSKKKITFFHSCGVSPVRKGTDLLLEAFNKLDRKNAELIIHNQLDLIKALPKKEELIERLLDETSLRLIEETVTAPGLYYMGDVYVYPTRLEGIGLTIAEAISSGLPTIVTDAQPMNEFVDPEKCGKLVNVDNQEKRYDNYYWPQSIASIEDLTKQMEYYVGNRELIGQYKDKARRYAEEHLNWYGNCIKFLSKINSIEKSADQGQKDIVNKIDSHANNNSLLEKIKGSFGYRRLVRFVKGIKILF